MSPQPFKVNIPQEKIDKLKAKLALTEFPDELEESGWDLGAPLQDIKRLTKAWQKWDWRTAEENINKLPQFHMGINVDGFGELDIHFVWQKSSVKNAIPLLFSHGWPGSFLEVEHILPLLSKPDGPAFHIVAPSLPNYGFSSGPKKRGFGAAQYAETCHKLMLSLGYTEYVTQGGDWGFTVTRAMAFLYPKHCKATHINLLLCAPPSWVQNPILALEHRTTPYTEKEKAGLARSQWFEREGFGYNLEQSTKPQTIGYALHDSPVALLAWIYEKMHDWTDGYPWTDEQILTWVSVYWFSRAGPAAAGRIYYESVHTERGAGRVTKEELRSWIGGVKLGLAYNPKDLFVPPKAWARTLGPVVFESDNESGGHFYATERPELLARDLKEMFGKGGGAYGVVNGKSGYDN